MKKNDEPAKYKGGDEKVFLIYIYRDVTVCRRTELCNLYKKTKNHRVIYEKKMWYEYFIFCFVFVSFSI